MTDFIFMVKETSHMFITGPDVIKTVTGEEVEFEELGGAMTHNSEVGRGALRRRRRGELPRGRALPHVVPAAEQPRAAAADGDRRRPRPPGTGLDRSSPTVPNKPYDMRDVVHLLVDNGEFFEVQEHFARNIIIGFSRLNGRPIGIVGNQPPSSPACSTSTRPRRRPASCASATPSTSRC